ncbi:cation diffusion facilitator family transporter [Gemmobacter sp.]|uniref:cation diffusion facilitator family transporter n=1 Tax=Gemmobacter sp. TaxID=1898957 RepID=UPI002AFE901E|nr:cation diffusion facilitator family transporter [Gemmobacter sp.]
MSDPDSLRLNLSAARASVGVALALIAVKLWALWATGALSIAASLADSTMDLIMSAGAMLAVRYAALPPDDDHAFGHTSAEDLTAFVQSLFLTAAAIGLVVSAISRLMAETPPTLASEAAGILAMVISMALTGALVLWQGHVARRTGNRVIAADRLHYMADLLPALGAIAALVASRLWGLWQLDAVVALVAAAVLARGAWTIGRGAWDALMDRRADPEVLEGIARIASSWPGVRGWHDLKTRTAGSRIFVNLHIELDGDQSLREAHDIGAALRRAILEAYPQADVIIHKDVADPPRP